MRAERSSLRSRRVMPLVACALAIGASLTAGLYLALTSSTTPVIAAPLAPPAKPTVAPVVTVEAPPVPIEAAKPLAPERAEPEPARAPIATRPVLDPACIDWLQRGELPESCRDGRSGFPAISGDGRLIVDAIAPDFGLSDGFGLTIEFIDAKTGKTKRTISIVDMFNPSQDELTPALLAKVGRRIKMVQAELVARKYRALRPLGELDTPGMGLVSEDESKLQAEWDGTALQVSHPATREVIGRHEFDGAYSFVSNEFCSYRLMRITASWDLKTRIVFGRAHFGGGDFCANPTVVHVFTI